VTLKPSSSAWLTSAWIVIDVAASPPSTRSGISCMPKNDVFDSDVCGPAPCMMSWIESVGVACITSA
jgi:hypothetical protein